MTLERLSVIASHARGQSDVYRTIKTFDELKQLNRNSFQISRVTSSIYGTAHVDSINAFINMEPGALL